MWPLVWQGVDKHRMLSEPSFICNESKVNLESMLVSMIRARGGLSPKFLSLSQAFKVEPERAQTFQIFVSSRQWLSKEYLEKLQALHGKPLQQNWEIIIAIYNFFSRWFWIVFGQFLASSLGLNSEKAQKSFSKGLGLFRKKSNLRPGPLRPSPGSIPL